MHAVTIGHHAREQPRRAAFPLHAAAAAIPPAPPPSAAAALPTAAIGPVPRTPLPAHGRNRRYEAAYLATHCPSMPPNPRPLPARGRHQARAPPSTAARLRGAGLPLSCPHEADGCLSPVAPVPAAPGHHHRAATTDFASLPHGGITAVPREATGSSRRQPIHVDPPPEAPNLVPGTPDLPARAVAAASMAAAASLTQAGAPRLARGAPSPPPS
ncbi:hypothetical protein SEVIR_2G358666v4 [Setaria viridis]|uniref:Uncharacterized protein n=1 Tax=Setaria viridis TaxID=4556 RepID=A0A4U6VYX4_SETVI|nr:hypothetical protein SEVIR_2G358666v2 [Setaria viridis]